MALRANLTVNELMTLKGEMELEILKCVRRANTYFEEKTGIVVKNIEILMPAQAGHPGMDVLVTLNLDVLDALLIGRKKVDGALEEDCPGQQYIFGSEL